MAELFTQPHTQPDRIFYNTSLKNQLEIQKKQVRPDFLTPLQLGKSPSYVPTDMFYNMYGKPLDMHKPPPYLHTFEKNSVYPIPYLINETNNKLVDVLGVYYRNKDLRVIPTRM